MIWSKSTRFVYKYSSNKEAFVFANTIISVGLIIVLPFIIIGEFFAPFIINIIMTLMKNKEENPDPNPWKATTIEQQVFMFQKQSFYTLLYLTIK